MPLYAVTLTPRFYETDALGHINNASIAAWLEVVRMTYIDSLGKAGADSVQSWILASLKIDFVAETFFGSDVIATVTQATVGNSSLTVTCEMSQGGKLTVRGTAVMVHMDVQTKTPSRIPGALREQVTAV